MKPRMRGWIHLWAFFVAIAAGSALVAVASIAVSAEAGIATAIYSLTVCGVFGVSATYHRVHWKTDRARMWMKRADHSMIFLFIAGSYTPFSLLALPPQSGSIVLAVVWTGALAGVALKMIWPSAPRWLGVPLYIILGWAIVFVIPTLIDNAGVPAMVLLAVGGVFYSIGGVLYALRWPNPWPHTFGFHEVFHAATAVAAICHYIAVWLVVFG